MYQEKIAPIEQAMKQERLKENMSKMDADPEYANWRDFGEEMAQISETLPEAMQDNPTLDNVKDIYWMAVRKSGKLPEVMAKAYAADLKLKQSKSTERPATSTAQGAFKQAMTMTEAYSQAKNGSG